MKANELVLVSGNYFPIFDIRWNKSELETWRNTADAHAAFLISKCCNAFAKVVKISLLTSDLRQILTSVLSSLNSFCHTNRNNVQPPRRLALFEKHVEPIEYRSELLKKHPLDKFFWEGYGVWTTLRLVQNNMLSLLKHCLTSLKGISVSSLKRFLTFSNCIWS